MELSYPLGRLDDIAKIDACEQLLNAISDIDYAKLEREADDPKLPEIKMREETETYRVVMKKGEAQDRRWCLYTALTVREVIAHVEGGKCGFCEGKRSVCTTCTPRWASAMFRSLNVEFDLPAPFASAWTCASATMTSWKIRSGRTTRSRRSSSASTGG
ncbi:hypothetical protein IMZ48_33385 [Candidatus Bathyarchaeota archaeon]|nr:hypothetical protein [Candidatus Bathyarchaeota archaeon]